MRLLVLVTVGIACLAAVIHPAEASRSKRTIGSWFSKLWKRWKKEPEPTYSYQPQPIYHPPPVIAQPHYGPPPPVYHAPPPVHHEPVYKAPPPIHHEPVYQAPPPPVHHGKGHGFGGPVKGGHGKGGGHAIGGHGKGGGHAIGGHGKGGGHAIGGHGKGGGHAIGGHGKGGHVTVSHGKGHAVGGHGKGGGHIPHGFGPVKHSDVVGHAHHGPPPVTVVEPGPSYAAPPPSDLYGPPVETYVPPPAPAPAGFGPPHVATETFSSHGAPAPAPIPQISDSYSAPSAPVSAPIAAPVVPVVGPPVSELSNDYRAPPSFPPPMAAHGSSSSSYLEGTFQPSQPLPIEQALPAPPAPLYDLPAGPDVPVGPGGPPILVPDGAPAPIEVLPPAPLALEDSHEDSLSVGDVPIPVVTSGADIHGGPGTVGIESVAGRGVGGGGGGYSAPAVDLTYGSQLGAEDPIIEIVFQDGDPAPAPPPPIIDPDLFALPDDDVEVYFIEYAPGDNLDDLAALSLDGAQPGILYDLPQELPVDVRSQLVDSGILEDAEIQVIDLEDALSQDILDVDTRTALEAAYGAESRIQETRVDAPSQDVALKVHRLSNEQGSPGSTAELLSRLQSYREGRYIGLVKTSDNEASKYLPVTVDGEKLPLPNTLDLGGQKVTEVLVVATNEEDEEDASQQEPPGNTNNPEHNLVAETSEPQAVVVVPAGEVLVEGIDRQWHGDPNGWRPIWN